MVNVTPAAKPKTLDLEALAARINALAMRAADARLEFCVALAEAHDRVPKETQFTFKQWAHANLRKPNGTPWAYRTIENSVWIGRKPSRLDDGRKAVIKRNREIRSGIAGNMNAFPVPDQVAFLKKLWDAASEEVRREFLKLITPPEPQKETPA